MIIFILFTNPATQQILPGRLKRVERELITYDNILAAIENIGVTKACDTLKEYRNIIIPRWNVLNNRYIHSEEEAALIASYTYENNIDPENSPYKIINRKLWEDDIHDQTSDIKSYLYLLLRALRKLPRTRPQTLYRGIKDDKHNYKVDEKLLWKGFSSTSTSMEVTQDFLTDPKTNKICGTLFEIQNMWGYNVSDFSKFPKEQGLTVIINTYSLLHI